MPTLRITDSTGDTRLPFTTERPEELAGVAFQFEQFSAKGYAAFAGGQKLKAFDPEVGDITMIAPIVSG